MFFFNTKIESTKEWIFDTFLNSDSDRNTTHTYTVELFFFILFWDGWLNFIQSFFFSSFNNSFCFFQSLNLCACVCVWTGEFVFFSLKKKFRLFFLWYSLDSKFLVEWMNECLDGWMAGWMDRWMWINAWKKKPIDYDKQNNNNKYHCYSKICNTQSVSQSVKFKVTSYSYSRVKSSVCNFNNIIEYIKKTWMKEPYWLDVLE